jgi:DNA-binding transcriptional MerR regulator
MPELPIHEVAAQTGLTAHTLRYYERAGLLLPIERAPSGHRRYSDKDVKAIQFLTRLRAAGMPVADIQQYVELAQQGDATVQARLDLLEQHRASVEHQLEQLQQHLQVIQAKIDHYRDHYRDQFAGQLDEAEPAGVHQPHDVLTRNGDHL